MEVILGVDATDLASHEEIKCHKFKHIFLSQPHSNGRKATVQLINGVYKSIALVQEVGGYYHLCRPNLEERTDRYKSAYGFHDISIWWRNNRDCADYKPINNTIPGYKAVAKTEFPRQYEGWEHTTTRGYPPPKILKEKGSVEVTFERQGDDTECKYHSPRVIGSLSPRGVYE
mmetsp:Transcript_25884/g.36161  ORF Transcript_25884/g.36161 Transcript_25884/m.36161 type:complete len:173 (+) Transcript_25884:541-1059(+)